MPRSTFQVPSTASPASPSASGAAPVPGASRRRRDQKGTDVRSLEVALTSTSLLIWLPYVLGAFYVAYCCSFQDQTIEASTPTPAATGTGGGDAVVRSPAMPYPRLYYFFFPDGFDIAAYIPLCMRVAVFSAVAMLGTYYLAVHRENGGEYLMALAWAMGVWSGWGWLTTTAGVAASSPSTSSAGSDTMPGVAGATSHIQFSSYGPSPPPWMWLVVSLASGFFSGILCKVKDIVDGKHDRDTHLFSFFDSREVQAERRRVRASAEEGGSLTQVKPRAGYHRRSASQLVSIGDRLYMVVPFCTGQWFAYILKNGWRGVFIENMTIVLSLSMVGYTMLSYKLLKQQVLRASGRVSHRAATVLRRRSTAGGAGAPESTEEELVEVLEEVGEVTAIDLIDLISKLFTTSFGVVVLVVVALNIFVTSLAIPFLRALFTLHALVSSVGIVVELIMYEVA